MLALLLTQQDVERLTSVPEIIEAPGDLIRPVEEGILRWEDVRELGQVVAGVGEELPIGQGMTKGCATTGSHPLLGGSG